MHGRESPCARISGRPKAAVANHQRCRRLAVRRRGLPAGLSYSSVDGNSLRDVLDWRWYADGEEITVAYVDTDGEAGEVDLFRDEGEDWGIDFDGAVFDKIKTCRNACVFCFMRQLPRRSRALRSCCAMTIGA